MKLEENKGVTLIAVLLIIIVLLLALIGGALLLSYNKTENQVENSNNLSQSAVKNDDNTEDSNNIEQIENKEVITKEMTADEKNAQYLNGLKNSLTKFKEATVNVDGEKLDYDLIININQNNSKVQEELKCITINYNGDAYITLAGDLEKKYNSNYKIGSNIVDAGSILYGQDASLLIWTINDKGEFSYMTVTDFYDCDIKFKVLNNVRNIVSVKGMNNGEALVPVAIDIEGKIIELEV